MNTISVSMSTLVDRALLDLQDPTTVPLSTTLSADITSSSPTFTVADATSIFPSSVLEIGSELLLVTAKSADATPVLTVSRGYYGSTAAAHTTTEMVYVNPKYPRVRVAEAIRRAFPTLESGGLPLVVTATFNRVPGLKMVEMPAETRDVLRVGYVATDGRWWDIPQWSFVDNVPTTVSTTGKLVRVPRAIYDDDDLHITYRTPYRWSNHPSPPVEGSTVTMYEGTENLPAAYAAAWILSRREMKRTEIETSQEWNQGEPSRSGVSTAVVRLQWQEFYRQLDEARRLVPSLPVHRPYVRMAKL